MYFSKIKISIALLVIVSFVSCDLFNVDEVQDPNNPTVEAILAGATAPQLQNLATGLEFRHRTYNATNIRYTPLVGTFGREVYPIYNSDPNFWRRWVGVTDPPAENDPTFFLAVFPSYTAPYNAIKQANLILLAVENTDVISEQEKNGYRGFANTIKGFQYLIPLLTQYRDPGSRDPAGSIRIDVDDFLNPGPFKDFDAALADIRTILDQGFDQLANAGSNLHFADNLSSGFDGFKTPAGMQQLNRAIAARAAIYAEDWQGALNALNQSFMVMAQGEENMNIGGYHVFNGPPDIFNPLFWNENQISSQILMTNPNIVADTLAGDERADKFFQRDEPVFFTGESQVAFDQQFQVFKSNTDPMPFIRNEELILIYAEAQAQLNNPTEAVNAIDIIRETWGVGPYTGPTDLDSLIDEILFQRTYSLFGEGHRWIDMRRYDRLDEIDTSLDNGRVPLHLSRPLQEINWEELQNTAGS